MARTFKLGLLAAGRPHSTLGTQCMLAATVLLLAVRRHVRTGLLLVLYVEGALLLNIALKQAFARDRPALA